MADAGFVSWITSAAPPAWLAFFGAFIWGVKTWDVWKARIMAIKAGDDALVGAQWKRFQEEIDRLVERVKALEDKCSALELEVSECHDRESAERAGRLEAEAMLIGRGRAHQEAQRIVSEERERDRYGKPKQGEA